MVGRTKDRSDTRETLFLIFSGISTRRFLVRTTLFTISIGPILFSLEGPTRAERGFETHSPHSFLFFSTPPPPPLPLHISRMRICDEGRTKGESTASWKAHTKIESATSIAYTIRESCVKARPTDVGRAFICNVAGRSHDAAAYAPTRLYSSRYASNRISFQTMCVTIVIVDLSLFGFRVQSRGDLKGMKTSATMMFRESWRMTRKKFFFLLGITRESGRELSKGDCSCRWLTKKLCNPSFIFPFSRAFDDCKISLSEILCRNVWEARDLKERDFEVLLTRDRETIVTNKLFVRQRRSETTYNLVLLRTNPYPRYFLWEKPASLRNARICIV